MSGLHFDNNKPELALLDPVFLNEMGEVLTFGKQKYGANNWRNGIAVSRLVSSAYRHLGAFNGREENDPESGKSHLAHLACNAMFLHWTINNAEEFDDRYLPTTWRNWAIGKPYKYEHKSYGTGYVPFTWGK